MRELAGDERNHRIWVLLHGAYQGLSDVAACRETLERMIPGNEEDAFEVLLLRARDAEWLARDEGGYYRISPESKAGLTNDEYNTKWRNLAAGFWREVDSLAGTEARRAAAAQARRLFERKRGAERTRELLGEPAPADAGAAGALAGRLTFPDGSPVSDAALTLGLEMRIQDLDPAAYAEPNLGLDVAIGEQRSLAARTDAEGRFLFEGVPAGRHEFLAVALDPAQFDIATRFVAQGIEVARGKRAELDLVVGEWRSASTYEVATPFAERLVRAGTNYRLVHEEKLHNPFHYPFPRQDIRFHLPPGVPTNPEKLLLLSSAEMDAPQAFQIAGSELLFFADLPALTDRVFALYLAEAGRAEPFANPGDLLPAAEPDGTAVVETGRASFRIPFGKDGKSLPPLLSVRGEDGKWRGRGRFKLPAGVSILSGETAVTAAGPLLLQWTTRYELSNGGVYEVHFTAHRGEPYLLAHEISTDMEGAAFEFSLSEFAGGRGFLQWTAESPGGNLHWSSLGREERELARLQESVPWWIPPAGFGFAMTPEGLDEKDYIGVFTIRRGEWIDRKFARITQGPIDVDGKENRELDWPFPEMVGSTVSMITAHTAANGGAGDAFFRFGFFDGERRWGLLVSTLERNDGRFKEFAAVQHKNSSPRLQDFKDWHLDEQDRVTRPYVIGSRKELRGLRRRKELPRFRALWEAMRRNQSGRGVQAFLFALDGDDPVGVWRLKKELAAEAPVRARMVLFGRDMSDVYSPVGGRWISRFMENYDLIAGSGAFTPEEERTIRAYFILMAHMFMEPDHMNWRFNSRNANFEADRVEIVGSIGLAFHGHPCSQKFLSHAAELLERSLNVYCTPGSGKWYENPACYYLAALGPRINLMFHLAHHGIFDPTRIERLKDFLRWGVLLLTPPFPHEYEVLYDGCGDKEYLAAGKVRRIPPIGDHARLGTWVPDHYAMMSKLYRASDPALADLLLWAFQAGGCDGGYSSNKPALFSTFEESDLQPAPAARLASRRLEGFGAVFRGGFDTEREFYLLFKQGPGGYRYQRTEGSIILFADGKPLIYDGGEAGETWRHTTLSFYDAQMPLACGHVERFYSFDGVDFCQGVHPAAIKPGEPVQLNDDCNHKLVQVAWKRYREPNPVDVRSVLWVKNEYIILHDDLRIDPSIPSHWHAQIVADGETGNARDGYVFKGRFGTDLQVLFPGQSFAAESCENLSPLEYDPARKDRFFMRHLQLTGDKADHYLAVMRPLGAGKEPVRGRAIHKDGKTRGVGIEGKGIEDLIFLARDVFDCVENGVRFQGRYGMAMKRSGSIQLVLAEGTMIEAGGVLVESSGPAVSVTVGPGAIEIAAEGDGEVSVTHRGKKNLLRVKGRAAAVLSA